MSWRPICGRSQISAVELLPQASQTFDYAQSQVGGLVLRYSPQLMQSPACQERIQQILDYYSQRYAIAPEEGTTDSQAPLR